MVDTMTDQTDNTAPDGADTSAPRPGSAGKGKR